MTDEGKLIEATDIISTLQALDADVKNLMRAVNTVQASLLVEKTDTKKLTYSVKEAANQIGVHPHQVRMLIKQGYLPQWKCGGLLRIRHRDLVKLIEFDIPALRPRPIAT